MPIWNQKIRPMFIEDGQPVKFRCYCILIAQHFDEVWNSEACNRMCDNCCEDIETSYLKIGSKANLNSDAHLITMQVKKPMQSCFRINSEGADKKREEKNPDHLAYGRGLNIFLKDFCSTVRRRAAP
uniref:ATP-dependent DNA helicase Q1-like isoform X2 n=1 Tax=Halichoerus grypus TaxID=9711 RepID=UPI0016598900|nr:ATP-dependent DNA helicase Q1-like isoform X2 [Halichoerus grypus]